MGNERSHSLQCPDWILAGQEPITCIVGKLHVRSECLAQLEQVSGFPVTAGISTVIGDGCLESSLLQIREARPHSFDEVASLYLWRPTVGGLSGYKQNAPCAEESSPVYAFSNFGDVRLSSSWICGREAAGNLVAGYRQAHFVNFRLNSIKIPLTQVWIIRQLDAGDSEIPRQLEKTWVVYGPYLIQGSLQGNEPGLVLGELKKGQWTAGRSTDTNYNVDSILSRNTVHKRSSRMKPRQFTKKGQLMTGPRSLTRRKALVAVTNVAASVALSSVAFGADKQPTRKIPTVPGMLTAAWRRREKDGEGFRVIHETVEWNASETAIIVCDMWADHPCEIAAMRVARMASRMNKVISLARDHGVAIIHAPSSGVEYYEGTPHRQRIKNARSATPPVPIQAWCYHNKDREGPWPIVDDIARGEAKVTGCDDPIPRPHKATDRHQHPDIRIIGHDGISDNGQEIFNFLVQEGRNNVVLMGVHTNMCVLGRPFGIRQQKYLGKNVVLCRDLTDALYDPRDKPYVSHARWMSKPVTCNLQPETKSSFRLGKAPAD